MATTLYNSYGFTDSRCSLSDEAFDQVLASLKQLNPVQLRFLKEQIHDSLERRENPVLTNEELDVLSSLFTPHLS